MLTAMVNRKISQVNVMGTSKGVGGYRPQVDWRDISVQKKRTAGKQIIKCILLSGFFIIIIGIFITIIGFFVIGNMCPYEWNDGKAGCLYNPNQNYTYFSLIGFCEDQGATLPVIKSADENEHVASMIRNQTWLALFRRGNEDFTWPGSETLNYNNWTTTIDNKGLANMSYCAMINTDGSWREAMCEETGYILCMISPGYNPFVLVGPVLILSGLSVLILSVEVCDRRRQFLMKNPDVGSDEEQLTSGPGTPVKEVTKNNDDGNDNSAFDRDTPLPNQVLEKID